MDRSETEYKNNNVNNKMNNFVNIFEKEEKVKKNLFLQYDINNPILLEDPKFRTLIIAKHWFTIGDNDIFAKIIHNPYLKEKDYNIVKNIKNHHERNIDTLFYFSFILYFFKIRNSFSKKEIKGLMKKSILLFSFPILLISYSFVLKPWYLNNRINDFVIKNQELLSYTRLDIDLKLINKELSNYKIKI